MNALEVLAANGVTVLVDSRDGYTPTPALSHAILTYNRGPHRPGSPTASWSPRRTTRPRDGGFKYNPPNGGPADTDATGWIQDRANDAARRRAQARSGGSRYARALAADTTGDVRLPRRVRRRPAVGARPRRDPRRPASASAPTRSAAPASAYWGAIAERHRLDLTVVNPTGRPDLAVHDAGLGRQDPDGLLVAVRDGVADRRSAADYQVATGNDADADRHGIVTPDAGLMNPNHYLAVAIAYLFAHRDRLAGRTPRSARRWCPRR